MTPHLLGRLFQRGPRGAGAPEGSGLVSPRALVEGALDLAPTAARGGTFLLQFHHGHRMSAVFMPDGASDAIHAVDASLVRNAWGGDPPAWLGRCPLRPEGLHARFGWRRASRRTVAAEAVAGAFARIETHLAVAAWAACASTIRPDADDEIRVRAHWIGLWPLPAFTKASATHSRNGRHINRHPLSLPPEITAWWRPIAPWLQGLAALTVTYQLLRASAHETARLDRAAARQR